MAAGLTPTYGTNWYFVYTGSAAAGNTLPFQMWPKAGSVNLQLPFIPRKMVWETVSGAQGDRCVITDNAGTPFVQWVATGADFMPPLEWERELWESGPIGAIITVFDSGELWIYP